MNELPPLDELEFLVFSHRGEWVAVVHERSGLRFLSGIDKTPTKALDQLMEALRAIGYVV